STFALADAEDVAAGGTIATADVADLLAALVERSMVRAGDDGYRMLETLRAFGLARLEEAGERVEVADRHAAHFARRARGAEGRLRRGAEAVESAQLLADQLGDEGERDRTRAIAGLALLLARDAPAALRAFAGLEERFAARGERWIAGFVAGWTGFVSLLGGE